MKKKSESKSMSMQGEAVYPAEIQNLSKENREKEKALLHATNKAKVSNAETKELQELFHNRPFVWQALTDLAKQMQLEILDDSANTSVLCNEAFRFKLASMRDELGWNASGQAEKILIEQICLNWLRLNLLERVHYKKTTESHKSETGLYWDKRLESAQRRYLRAIESLAKVRKLIAQADAQNAKIVKGLLTAKD